MIKHIHFCTIGKKWELPVAVCQSGLEVSKIYLLNSVKEDLYKDVERQVLDKLRGVNIKNIETIPINPYDFEDVYLKVLSKCKIELEENNGNCRFHFNFTAGTNIVAGAICSAAHLIPNVDFYYLQEAQYRDPPSNEDIVIHIESPSSDDLEFLKSKKQTAQIFINFSEYTEISNKRLSEITGKQLSALSYHTDMLSRRGLISRLKRESVDSITECEENARTVWQVTPRGKKVLDAYLLKIEIENFSI